MLKTMIQILDRTILTIIERYLHPSCTKTRDTNTSIVKSRLIECIKASGNGKEDREILND